MWLVTTVGNSTGGLLQAELACPRVWTRWGRIWQGKGPGLRPERGTIREEPSLGWTPLPARILSHILKLLEKSRNFPWVWGQPLALWRSHANITDGQYCV